MLKKELISCLNKQISLDSNNCSCSELCNNYSCCYLGILKKFPYLDREFTSIEDKLQKTYSHKSTCYIKTAFMLSKIGIGEEHIEKFLADNCGTSGAAFCRNFNDAEKLKLYYKILNNTLMETE